MAKHPSIRFNDFSDEWEEKQLNNFIEPSYETNKDNKFTKDDVLSVSGEEGIVNQIEFKGRSFAGEFVDNYGVVNTGYIVYTKSPLKLNPYGIIKTNKGKPGIVSTLYAIYKPINNTYPDFVQEYFGCDQRLNKYLVKLVNKGAKNDMKISSEGAISGLVSFPNRDEQIKLSIFFNYISELIFSTQDKLDKAKILKKSMLEKMFPKDGAKAPELRLKGFSDEYEYTSTLKIFEVINDKNHPELPVLSASQEYGMVYRNEIGGSNISYNKNNQDTYKRILPGQFAIHLRSFQGGFAHSDKDGICSPAYTIMKFIEPNRNDEFYWKYLFTSDRFIKRLELITYGIRDGRSISFEDFSTFYFYLPTKEEQKKIGSFFVQLDSLIYSYRDEIEKLKTIKKSLLEKMFI